MKFQIIGQSFRVGTVIPVSEPRAENFDTTDPGCVFYGSTNPVQIQEDYLTYWNCTPLLPDENVLIVGFKFL